MAKFKLVEYQGGQEVDILETDNYEEAQRHYLQSYNGDVSIRLWVDGTKLTYAESYSFFSARARSKFRIVNREESAYLRDTPFIPSRAFV